MPRVRSSRATPKVWPRRWPKSPKIRKVSSMLTRLPRRSTFQIHSKVAKVAALVRRWQTYLARTRRWRSEFGDCGKWRVRHETGEVQDQETTRSDYQSQAYSGH